MFGAHRLFAPNLFEVVVLANDGLHDVGHGRATVHDDPLAVFFAFDAGLVEAGFAHGVAHAGGQSLGLAVGGAAGDDHALKQGREVLGVEHHDVLALDVFQAIDDGALEFLDVFFGSGFAGHEGF